MRLRILSNQFAIPSRKEGRNIRINGVVTAKTVDFVLAEIHMVRNAKKQVADVAGYESQHPSLPHIKIIDTFPELPLDDAACALEAEIAQGEQAIDKHGSPVQDCYQQKTCLDLGRGSFIPATKGWKKYTASAFHLNSLEKMPANRKPRIRIPSEGIYPAFSRS